MKDHLPSWQDLPGTEEELDSWWVRVSAADDDADCYNCGETICPFRSAREAASLAHVIVANHHLVAADFLLRQKAGISLFALREGRPPEILVLDEAHDFADAMRSALETIFSVRRWKRLQNDLVRFAKDLAKELYGVLYLSGAERKLVELNKEMSEVEEELRRLAEEADVTISTLLSEMGEVLKQSKKETLLLFPGPEPENKAVLETVEAYCTAALRRIDAFVGRLKLCTEVDKKLLRRVERLHVRCEEFLEAVRRTVLLERHYRRVGAAGDSVEFDGRKFTARPVKVAEAMAELWQYYSHVVLTSATLFPFPQSAGFGWFRDEYGFGEQEIVMGVVPSPFRWEEQMQAIILTCPELLPVESSNGDATAEQAKRRVKKLAEIVVEVTKLARGGVLALFTSYREMTAVANLVQGGVPVDRLLLVQGRDGGKVELLDRFKAHGRAVLFGVASFWQGVDVPGDALEVLIISKLPFPQPEDATFEALKWLAGREWWQKVCRPLTALTLRQGVGRLIRTEEDRGVVILADPRAAGKHRWFVENCIPVEPQEVESLWVL